MGKQGKGNDEKKGPKTLEEKVRALCGEECVDGILSETSEESQVRLMRLAKEESETMDFLQNDDEVVRMRDAVKEAKEALKLVDGPSKDTLKGIALQRKLIAETQASRGK